MTADIIPGFTGARIDRADAIRNDPARLAEARGAASARLLRLNGLDPEGDEHGQLVWGSLAEASDNAELAFLGLVDGKPRWVALALPETVIDARSRTVWRVLSFLTADQIALYGAARSLVDWHARHQFCANCGGPTYSAKGGWQRTCSACGAQHFPRTDPVVIMLAEHDGSVLVGRQPPWPKGNFSALAGFIEPGESIEEAVARELFEEAGVTAVGVRYTASQPWPFPSSLMIGCIASVTDKAIILDTNELEAAMWVTRDEVAAAVAGAADARFTAPPVFAIAHSLFKYWLAGR